MDITFDLETLLTSLEFRKKLNESLESQNLALRIAILTPTGLVLGETPYISPFDGEDTGVGHVDWDRRAE
ncbi:TPA_asm: hypothetical protein [ssRNA phage Gerhypos.4_59]|uniref:Uncharacterized protein n=2 Tax=Norzivirales TaxID=2842247 RepID=A0A8S5L0C9_9VIRU|nr:hypothetical protein QII98_gp3 [ssRNA phage Gerhypos.4_59]QDH90584.1 MAG: hypothetical protein H4Bulk47420_000003 [Leviviridae sp.]DAD50578.1 TPA_asm: hypothetical protein [ssRNA phage Gerhypos.4_59]